MFLRSLKIENRNGVIREICFHAGLNLIIDETPTNARRSTGNNVGKTTVLKLIDLCLGGDPRRIYTDLENPKVEYREVRDFLVETRVLVTLSLCESLEASSGRDMVIERNFLPRTNAVRRINGQHYTEVGFEEYLTNHLFPGHFDKKPTFPQLISHNIRYKEPGVSNTLRTLHSFTRDDEYEALYLFLLGCEFDQGDRKQELLARLRAEMSFKQRLERKQTKSAYEVSLGLLLDEIKDLDAKRATFIGGSDLEEKILMLGDVKYKKGLIASELARTRLRRDLVREAIRDVGAQKSDVDVPQLRKLYEEVSGRLGELTKTFEDLVTFHNKMVEEKVRYISKDLPHLDEVISTKASELSALTRLEETFVNDIYQNGTLDDIEEIIVALNERHRLRGEYETIIGQICAVDDTLGDLRRELSDLDQLLFSERSVERIQSQLAKFNRHFAAISEELYAEKYALKADRIKNSKTGQQIFQFSCFNTNFSSGKKQGEITCFDIAYTLFADEEGIPCYHFLLSDKKELMHDNQLERIGRLVERKSDQVQFVASILRDKLPPELDQDEFVVVRLSQSDKLLRIEGKGAAPA